MADLRQLRADIVASVLAKCLEAITNCYIKLEVNGLLTVTIDSNNNLEIPVSAVCHKAISEGTFQEQAPPEADSTDKTESVSHNAKIASLTHAGTMNDQDLGKSSKCVASNSDQNENDDTEPGNSELYSDNSHLDASLSKESQYGSSYNQGYRSSPPMFQRHPMDSFKLTKNIPQLTTEHFLSSERVIQSPCSVKKRPSVKRKQYSSEALMNAYRKVLEDNASISSAARLFGVPRSTLRDKLQGHVPLVVGNYKMPNAEETQSNSESISMAETEFSNSSEFPLRTVKIEHDHFEGMDAVDDENVEDNSS